MQIRFLGLFLLMTAFLSSVSEPTQASDLSPHNNSAKIKLELGKLRVLGSVLYLAAHPDDENTALLAYFSYGPKYRVVLDDQDAAILHVLEELGLELNHPGIGVEGTNTHDDRVVATEFTTLDLLLFKNCNLIADVGEGFWNSIARSNDVANCVTPPFQVQADDPRLRSREQDLGWKVRVI